MQHAIDLLPESIRVRSEAGMRTGRTVAAVVLAVGILVVLITHSRFVLDRSRAELAATQVRANRVLSAEAKAIELSNQLHATRNVIANYRRIAHPIDLSDVIASVVTEMPAGLTLDRLDFDAAARRTSRSARGRAADPDQARPRQLAGELSGFAPSDQQIADFVSRLDDRPLFQSVSLDYTRTAIINEKSAREFRISFSMDLEAEYIIEDEDREVANVQ